MHNRSKIAFVCQRYGLEVNGGAELYCRQVAEKLSALYDVTVYTTCAIDYITWKNEYAPGCEDINGVHVKRYPVIRERKKLPFAASSKIVLNNPLHTDCQEEEWLDLQGPYCPALVEVIATESSQYQVVFFMTYLYYLTARGMMLNLSNAVLIPTTHDEPPVYLRCYDKVFANAKAFAWLTPEEKSFAQKRFPFIVGKPDNVFGVGIDMPAGDWPELPESLRGERYIVYAGRIDESKGCGELFNYYLRYKRENKSGLKLVLMGKEAMSVPKDSDIIPLGFVSDEMKFAVMAQAFALVLFSHFESLSMVVLESMMVGRPVLVNGHCEVLKGHCIRSNAGLYFENYPEFAATLTYLMEHPVEYAAMRENGRRYVEANYRWDVVVDKYKALIDLFD